MRSVVVAVLVGLCARSAAADDADDQDFGLRFTAALNRFARYPDVAALGGSGGGSPWSSSPNPASSGMNPSTGERGFGVSLPFSVVAFREGTRAHVGSISGSYDGKRAGVWQPSLVVVETNRAQTRDGLTFHWEAFGGEVQWGLKLTDATSIGVDVSVLHSKIAQSLADVPVSDSESTTWGARFGVLHKFPGSIHAGVALEVSAAPGTTVLHDFMHAGGGDVKSDDTTWGLTLRPGIYDKISEDLSAYADLQWVRFSSDAGTLRECRVSFGLDETVHEGIYVRGGAVVDDRGRIAPTFGIGIQPSVRLMFDLSWQYDLFPEIDREFGASHTFGLGVTVLF